MKKLLLFAMSGLCAYGVGNAAISISYANVDQPQGDTAVYALPQEGTYQDIQNHPTNNTNARVMRFQPEYMVTAKDFGVGDTKRGTATLPKDAKVTSLALNGYDVASQPDSHGMFVEVCAWCRNVTIDTLANIGILDGYRANPPKGELYVDTVNYRNPWMNTPGFMSYFDTEADSVNPGQIVYTPFNNPNANPAAINSGSDYTFDKQYPPFWYKGDNIILTLWVSNFNDILMKYRYMTYDKAEAEIASLFRTGSICFNNKTLADVKGVLGMDLMYDLPKHSLPAFSVTYYTNDIRFDVTTKDNLKAAKVKLMDADGNVIEPATDGNYYGLDHTKTYTVTVDGGNPTEVKFDNIYKDIVVTIEKNATAVEELNANREVSSVRYINLAGQQSAEPFEGVNIVVTSYNDGSMTTSKVIK